MAMTTHVHPAVGILIVAWYTTQASSAPLQVEIFGAPGCMMPTASGNEATFQKMTLGLTDDICGDTSPCTAISSIETKWWYEGATVTDTGDGSTYQYRAQLDGFVLKVWINEGISTPICADASPSYQHGAQKASLTLTRDQFKTFTDGGCVEIDLVQGGILNSVSPAKVYAKATTSIASWTCSSKYLPTTTTTTKAPTTPTKVSTSASGAPSSFCRSLLAMLLTVVISSMLELEI